MAVFVDPKTGEQYENSEPDAAEKAQQFGFVTPEQYEAEKRSGGLVSRVAAAGEEAIRQGAAVADLIPGVDSGAAPVGLTELEPGQAGNALTDVYSPEARERRAVNPGSAAIGAALPAVGASLLLPGSGAVGLATTIGVDALSGYSQAAVDAEIENRGISGADVLRNGGMNLAFSLPLFGLGAGAKAFMQGKRLSALERAAGSARDTAGARAASAEGADLAQAVADPAVQADLVSRVAANADEAVAKASERVSGLSTPTVARNPRAQREAVGAIADVFRTSDPELAARLDALTSGGGKKRLEGLRAIRDELAAAGESDALTAIDATVGREDLWGSRAIRGASDVDSVLGGIPAGDNPEQLIEYAARLRKVRDGEFAGMADEIEQLAERQLEIKTASAIGDVTPEAAGDVVDYGAAMRNMDPNEAWRLTHDGADEGLRQIESASVSDAMQRVDDVLREDVAMQVKRDDFVKGAESWTPAVIAKQAAWSAERLGKAEQLAADLAGAERQGRHIGGYRAEATGHIDRALDRIRTADPVTVNAEWDQLKRNLDGVAKRLAASPPGSIDDASKAWGSKAILELNDDLRKGLENSELFGRNAGLQKETNAAWVKVIDPYSRITKRMAEFLGRDFGVVGAQGIRRRFDADMVNSIMKGGYQKNLRADIDASIKGLDQMMQARQSQGLSRLDRLSKAREDLVRIRQGFDFADLLAVAKSKAKAPIGLEVIGRLADTATPGGFMGSVAGPVASRAKGAIVGNMPMLAPGSKSPLAGAVRRHLGLTRAEQATMLADPAFYERLPGSLQKQIMAGSAAGDRAVEMASSAADAARRDRELTARLMVNPADAKRARKAQRKKPTPAIDRARARASQRGSVNLGSGGSPVDLSGMSLKDLKANPDPGSFKPETLEALRTGKGGRDDFASDFGATGRVAQKGQLEQGIQVEMRGGKPVLVDGRHRLTVGREKGLSEVWGQVYQGVRTPGKKPIYEGPIPIAAAHKSKAGERGMVDLAGGIAKSPLGVGTGAAGATIAYHHLGEPSVPDPESMTPLQRFSDGYDKPGDAFRAARRMILDWQRDPEALVDMISGHVGDVGQLSPKLDREMTAQAMRIAGYLQDNLPGQRNVSVVYPDGTPPSRAEVRQFALRFGAAVDPAGVMADARMGRLERTQVDTLFAVWPQEYDALRAGVIQELGAGKATPQTRQRMSLLFSFGSEVDPALGPRTRAVVAAARGAQQEQAPAPSSPGMNRQKLPSTANMQPAGMAALSLGQQIGSP